MNTKLIREVLQLLSHRRNVLISGAPGTGKSRMLAEIAEAFVTKSLPTPSVTSPTHVPGSKVPIPAVPPSSKPIPAANVFPCPARTERKVFRTTFHQNSKHREFVSGLVPKVGKSAEFFVMEGTLFRASEHAKTESGASLLIIDEINRGPAVQIFGGSIVAIESDKRLKEDNSNGAFTQPFEILDPVSGGIIEYSLPDHLYLLAAMNQADTSVEPLDVAFLRRWAPYRLAPSEEVLRTYFKLSNSGKSLEKGPKDKEDVYEALVQAWSMINNRIKIGRGADFQVGHGVLMGRVVPPDNLGGALEFAAESWAMLFAHIEEVFFGDLRGIAAVLNVENPVNKSPFEIKEKIFADEPHDLIEGPDSIGSDLIYSLLLSIVE